MSNNSYFEEVTIPFRGKEIVIREVHAGFGSEVLEELETFRATGATEQKANDHFIMMWIFASVVSDNGKPLISESDDVSSVGYDEIVKRYGGQLKKSRPKKWFDAVWKAIDELNTITGKAQAEAEKNSEEVELTSDTSTILAESSDIPA